MGLNKGRMSLNAKLFSQTLHYGFFFCQNLYFCGYFILFFINVYNFIERAKHKRLTLATLVRINREEAGRRAETSLQPGDDGGLKHRTVTTQRVQKMHDNKEGEDACRHGLT